MTVPPGPPSSLTATATRALILDGSRENLRRELEFAFVSNR